MKLVIFTQHKENYGAHDWNGEGECPQYWKFKGGNTYVIRNLDVAGALEVTSKFQFVVGDFIESSDEYFEEYVVGYELLDDCEADPIEHWESIYELTWNPAGSKFNVRMVDHFDYDHEGLVGKICTHTLHLGGETKDHLVEYFRKDGSTITYADWAASKEAV